MPLHIPVCTARKAALLSCVVRQVLYIAYCFFCLIVLSAYTANLTSFLSITNLKTEVGSLQVGMGTGRVLCLLLTPGGPSSPFLSGSLLVLPFLNTMTDLDQCGFQLTRYGLTARVLHNMSQAGSPMLSHA